MSSHDELSGHAKRPSDPWKLKREVSTGDVLIAVSMLLGMFLWGQRIETRLAVVEESQKVQQRIDAAQDALVRDSVARIETAMRDIQQYILRGGSVGSK
jgi:hypothetical protein